MWHFDEIFVRFTMVTVVVFCNHATMFHLRLSRVMMLVVLVVHFGTVLKQEKSNLINFYQVYSSFIQFGPFATVLKQEKSNLIQFYPV
jgi:hypothetical protein